MSRPAEARYGISPPIHVALALLALGCGANVVIAVDSDGAAGSTSAGGADGGGRGGAATLPVVEPAAVLDVRASSVVSDETRGLLYVAVDEPGAEQDQLLTVDPSSGNVVAAASVGANPMTLAMSDDASTLWVSLAGSFTVRRVDLTDGIPVPGVEYDVPLPDLWWDDEPAAAFPMVVLPGTTNSLALSLFDLDSSPTYKGTLVLDDGIARPLRLSPMEHDVHLLVPGPSGWLMGLSYGDIFYSIEIGDEGLTATEHRGLIARNDIQRPPFIVYAEQRMFVTYGDVIDVAQPEAPYRVGGLVYHGRTILPIDQARQVLMLSQTIEDGMVLRLFDTGTFGQIGLAHLSNGKDLITAANLVAAGDRLAFIGEDRYSKVHLYILPNPFY